MHSISTLDLGSDIVNMSPSSSSVLQCPILFLCLPSFSDEVVFDAYVLGLVVKYGVLCHHYCRPVTIVYVGKKPVTDSNATKE